MLAIVREPIDPRTLEAAVRDDAYGGIATFLGVVRERADDGRVVTGLAYEAYERAAIEEFAKIEAEAQTRFGALRMAIVHRTGELAIGDIAVGVAVASVHRAAAFDACEYAIDELKRRAPIWKKEHYAGGGGEWKDNTCASGEPAH